MMRVRILWIALIVVGLLVAAPGVALADFAPAVPEPGTLTLLASGVGVLGGVGWLLRRKK